MIALQVAGDQNRVINEYYFQPFNPKGVAFANTIYQGSSFQGDYCSSYSTNHYYHNTISNVYSTNKVNTDIL